MPRLPLLLVATFLCSLLPGAGKTEKDKDVLSVEQALAVRRPGDLHFSPDGKKLVFSIGRPPKGTGAGQEIWLLDVTTKHLRRFAHSAKSDRSPRWSPDGRQLAFLSTREERSQISCGARRSLT
jgi:Tol biopolymer transport system component